MRMLLSILALWNDDPTILDSNNFPLPERINRAVMQMHILTELAELEILYPEPDVLKIALHAWASARIPQWERMLDALTEEYNPLHNYDRHEEWTDERTGEGTNSKTTTSQQSVNGTSSSATTTEGDSTGSEETNTIVAGFNDGNSLTPKDQTVTDAEESHGETVNTSGTSSQTGTGSVVESGTNSEDGTSEHTGHLYGNIGVTTSMTMLQEELAGRTTDIYQIITREFKQRFCLLVY